MNELFSIKKKILFTLTNTQALPQWRLAHPDHDFTSREYILLRYINIIMLKDERKGREKGRGEEKKNESGRKKLRTGGKKYFQRCWGKFSTMLCLETFPSTLKNEGQGRKKGEMLRKRCARKGKEYFQMCWGRFSLTTFPSTLKIEWKGRERGEGKMVRGEEKNQGDGHIFKADIFQIA